MSRPYSSAVGFDDNGNIVIKNARLKRALLRFQKGQKAKLKLKLVAVPSPVGKEGTRDCPSNPRPNLICLCYPIMDLYLGVPKKRVPRK